MHSFFNLSGQLTWLYNTIYFFKKHYLIITALGLIAAFGRVIQLGGFGKIPFWINISIEVVVESARILIFLYVLGLASIKNGVFRIKSVFKHKDKRKFYKTVAVQKLKQQWLLILLNITGFSLIAWVINYLIDLAAYETCLYITLKQHRILAASSSEWTILLFFKNISVIPFTLIFNAVFLLWITDKFRNRNSNLYL